MMKHSGSLTFGVEYPAASGQYHYDFTLRLPMAGDNIAAIEETGATSGLRIRVAMLARCLVSLGDIPAEAITYELLSEQLVDEDVDVLAEAEEAMKKKRMRPKPLSPTTASPSSSSDDTASEPTS